MKKIENLFQKIFFYVFSGGGAPSLSKMANIEIDLNNIGKL